MKLHLGCYGKKIPDFVNVDIRPEVNPDLLDDAFKLEKVKNGSVDLIYASHVLEHGDFNETEMALQRWSDVLKSGGKIRLAVPDMEAHFWDFDKLKKDLEKAGFTNVKRYDWRKTEHHYIDDYSQAYCPHMDKENGKLMSLNVEATKI